MPSLGETLIVRQERKPSQVPLPINITKGPGQFQLNLGVKLRRASSQFARAISPSMKVIPLHSLLENPLRSSGREDSA